MRKPLLSLTAAAFGIGTSEFIIVGLLPMMSRQFAVSIPRAGILVTAYALSVTFGSPLVALALSRLDRKQALLWLMGLFVLGNSLCAMAPTFLTLLAARVLTALCHGAFFGIGSVVAARMVPRNERARAISLMFSGLTLASILGVPAGTALGLHFGWRSTFWSLVPVGLIALLLLWRWVPHLPGEPAPFREELRAVLRFPVQLVLATSTLSSVSLFCVFTYISPMLAEVTHLRPDTITWALVLFGVGITGGNLLGGRLSDWRQMTTLIAGFGMLAVVLALMPAVLPYRVPALLFVVVWGAVHFAAGAPLQPRIVEKANDANLASTLNQSAFNFGNALGASLGGLLLTLHVPYRVLPLAAAVVALAPIGLSVLARSMDRRDEQVGQTAVAVGSA